MIKLAARQHVLSSFFCRRGRLFVAPRFVECCVGRGGGEQNMTFFSNSVFGLWV